MGREFDIRHEAQVPATAEEVFDAIASGPGIGSWFVGRTDVDGDTVRTAFGEFAFPDSHVTAAEPPHRFAHRSTEPGGRFVAYEFLVEGRSGAATVVRAVTSGFLPGDDWSAEFEAMGHCTELFFRTLVQYLTHFRGRVAVPVTAFGPPVGDWDTRWARLHTALGLSRSPAPGHPVHVTTTPEPVDGVVYAVNPHTLGVRTPDAMFRFLRGLHGGMVAAHHLFSPGATAQPDAWQRWLAHLPEGTRS